MVNSKGSLQLLKELARAGDQSKGRAIVALWLGATCIGFAPIFFRWSDVGPAASAFYRILLAGPVLLLVLCKSQPMEWTSLSKERGYFFAAGFFFAADLALWHWSLLYTSVAKSTLLTNLAPLLVIAVARFWFKEAIHGTLLLGFAIAFAGTYFLVRTPTVGYSESLRGDLLAIFTAFFYAGYLLAIKKLRAQFPGAVVLALSGLVACPLLLLAALAAGEQIIPQSASSWMALLGLAVVSHLAGQGLIVYALAHLQAGYSAITLIWQPVVAAALAASLLQESLTLVQVVGGIFVLLGIIIAQRSPSRSQN